MSVIRLTAKRQATFPKALCDDMGLLKGDAVEVEAAMVGSEKLWVLKPVRHDSPPWFGRFRHFAKGKPHDMQSVRASIARGRKHAHE